MLERPSGRGWTARIWATHPTAPAGAARRRTGVQQAEAVIALQASASKAR